MEQVVKLLAVDQLKAKVFVTSEPPTMWELRWLGRKVADPVYTMVVPRTILSEFMQDFHKVGPLRPASVHYP